MDQKGNGQAVTEEELGCIRKRDRMRLEGEGLRLAVDDSGKGQREKEGKQGDMEPAEPGRGRGHGTEMLGVGSQGHGACLTVAHPADYAGKYPEEASGRLGRTGRCHS